MELGIIVNRTIRRLGSKKAPSIIKEMEVMTSVFRIIVFMFINDKNTRYGMNSIHFFYEYYNIVKLYLVEISFKLVYFKVERPFSN